MLGLRLFLMTCLSGPSTAMEGHRKIKREASCTDDSIVQLRNHTVEFCPAICSMTGAANSDLIRSGW